MHTFDKQMYCLKVGQFVIVGIDADGEEEAGVASVDKFPLLVL